MSSVMASEAGTAGRDANDDLAMQDVEWEQAAEDSQVLLWQVQIAEQSVEHVPLQQGIFGKIADPAVPDQDPQAEAQRDQASFDIEFEARKDRYMVITKLASGDAAVSARAMMVGDMLIAVNGTPVLGMKRSDIRDLLASSPLRLTLGAEFKAGGRYVATHTLYNGDRVPVNRLAGVSRTSSEASEATTDTSDGTSDTVSLCRVSSAHANLPPSVDITPAEEPSPAPVRGVIMPPHALPALPADANATTDTDTATATAPPHPHQPKPRRFRPAKLWGKIKGGALGKLGLSPARRGSVSGGRHPASNPWCEVATVVAPIA
eukprot:CAMPEP_0173390344 /NCGR_PEP_ID=MMETSP1356-20130122/14524_1 /TAXON_ID=77927 ORGANISM="Hemiselmis virescens, Strain PCC157" /NCGR_SAMPLE_ID=MMETSP1356 /ASSEMBLY_ACC=CAM_ASM_000847 /LENGTH=318 /DNA_ID=CAMNT_0014347699 /DNA_START=61 /DNA_END=1017 /DNA_ORIENTATION=+